MNPKLFTGIVIANLLLVLAVVNGAIFQKQAIVSEGRPIYLKLLPRDPRSLIQGDYMVLRYAIADEAGSKTSGQEIPTRGQLVLKIDDRGIGSVSHFDKGDDFLEDELPLRYRKWRRGFRFGIESYFFEEGDAKIFNAAKFAEIRISENGEPVLVGLLDEELTPIERIEPEQAGDTSG